MARVQLPLLLMCALALHEGVQATAGLEWPWDRDAFRNIAQAQTAADGGWLSDPFFLDESAFYNPLLAWLVGALSRWLGQPAHVVYTAAGPYVDLLGPLSFYLLVARWFGGAVAVAGTFHLLFLNVRPGASGEPFWANPTYSPWALAANLGQPLFCLCLVALARAAATRRRCWFASSGALLGLTFLAHTAPAALLGTVALLDTLRASWKERSARPLSDLGILAACAVVVASPLLFSIVGRYHLRVLNAAPFEWRWLPSWRTASRILPQQLSVFSLLALPGLALLAWRPAPRIARRHAVLLLLTAAFFFATPFVEQHLGWRPLRVLQVVSQHHFWFYLRLLESVFVGFFLAVVTGVAGRALLRAGHVERRRYRLFATILSTVVVLAGLWVVYPSYRQRVSFKVGRNARQAITRNDRDAERTRLVAWMRRETGPREVFLASDRVALLVVGPAGRKTLVLDANFVSQYVDLGPREYARAALLRLLREGRREEARRIAKRRNVGYLVLWTRDRFPQGDAAAASLQPVYESRYYRVFRIG